MQIKRIWMGYSSRGQTNFWVQLTPVQDVNALCEKERTTRYHAVTPAAGLTKVPAAAG